MQDSLELKNVSPEGECASLLWLSEGALDSLGCPDSDMSRVRVGLLIPIQLGENNQV